MTGAGAIVLAGGRSSRMGRAKADLEWHGSTLLQRAAGLAARSVAGPVAVVRAPGRVLPALPERVVVVDDREEGAGPLHGLAVGLRALEPMVAVALAIATDQPLLTPALLRRLARLAAPGRAAAVRVAGIAQPLVAAYPTALAASAEALLAGGERRAGALLAAGAVRWLDEPELAALGAGAAAVRGLDDPAAYRAARALPPPEVTLLRVDGSAVTVAAATLGAALAAAGLSGPPAGIEVDGRAVADPELPLVPGDVVRLGVSGAPATPDPR